MAERPFNQELEVDVEELQAVACCQCQDLAKGKGSCTVLQERREVWLRGCEGMQVCLACAVKAAMQSSCDWEPETGIKPHEA